MIQRSKSLAALLLIATLLVGAALGYMAARFCPNEEIARTSEGYWDAIAKEWDLTDDQRVVIDSLLDVQQKRMAILYQPILAHMDSAAVFARAISDSTQEAMRQVLNEQQRMKLDQLREEARVQAAERRAQRTDWWRKVQ